MFTQLCETRSVPDIDFFINMIDQTIKFYYDDKIENEKEVEVLSNKKKVGRPKINNI